MGRRNRTIQSVRDRNFAWSYSDAASYLTWTSGSSAPCTGHWALETEARSIGTIQYGDFMENPFADFGSKDLNPVFNSTKFLPRCFIGNLTTLPGDRSRQHGSQARFLEAPQESSKCWSQGCVKASSADGRRSGSICSIASIKLSASFDSGTFQC